jgi:hypothetical protein
MKEGVSVTSPQFKTMLLRKLKNIAPTCEVEFVEGLDKGIGFLLKDPQGRYRSKVVRIYRHNPGTLEKKELIDAIKKEGMPNAGFPVGL